MPDYTNLKISVFPGINQNPIAPTNVLAGNGSHLIAQFNSLIDALNGDTFSVYKEGVGGAFNQISLDANDGSFFAQQYNGTTDVTYLGYYLGDLSLYSYGVERVKLSASGGNGAIAIDGKVVLREQQPHINYPYMFPVSGTGDDMNINTNFEIIISKIEQIINALRAHGLIYYSTPAS